MFCSIALQMMLDDVGRQLTGYSLKHTTIGNKTTPMKVFGME
jgi:hypothetical protein